MKWFKYDINERNKLTSKLLRSRYGVAGYGLFTLLKELVAENIGDDPETWGMVDKRHTLETLAMECGVETDYLKDFLTYCNEQQIFEKKDGCLYWPEATTRLDNWTLRSNSVATTKKLPNEKKKKRREKNKKIAKAIGEKSPAKQKIEKEFGNEHVNHVLASFKKLYGFSPTDKYPRRTAHTLTQQLKTLLKKRGKDPQNGVLTGAIDGYFSWVSHQDWADNVHNLDTVRRKLSIFEATLPEVTHEKN